MMNVDTVAAYLGADQMSFTLNFSKGASTIIGQYYQFLRLGHEGYRRIMVNLLNVAKRLEQGIRDTGESSGQWGD